MSELMKWYAIHVRPTQEYRALENLERLYKEIYLPQRPCDLRTVKRHNKGRSMEPLFPGSIFFRPSKENGWGPIRSTRGVIGVVKFGNYIPSIDDDFITNFKKFERQYKTDYELGDKVLVNNESFINVPAIVRLSTTERIQVLMDILGDKTLVNVERSQIQPQEA